MTKEETLTMAIDALEIALNARVTLWQNGCDCYKEHTCNPLKDSIAKACAEAIQACKEALEQPNMTYEDGFAHGYEAHRAEQVLEQPQMVMNKTLECPASLHGIRLASDVDIAKSIMEKNT